MFLLCGLVVLAAPVPLLVEVFFVIVDFGCVVFVLFIVVESGSSQQMEFSRQARAPQGQQKALHVFLLCGLGSWPHLCLSW